jgi:NADP-dependent 3-hydroxy acid dehydrogenase YdfG
MTNTCLITGGSGGLARALAALLRAEGWQLARAGRRPETLQPDEGDLLIEADVSTEAGALLAVAEASTRFGAPPTAVVNAAGALLLAPLTRTSEAQYRECLAANLDTAFFTAKAYVGALQQAQKAGGSGAGRLLLFSSVAAGIGVGNHAAIAMAKGAIEAWCARWRPTTRPWACASTPSPPAHGNPAHRQAAVQRGGEEGHHRAVSARPAWRGRRCGAAGRLPARPGRRLDHRAGDRPRWRLHCRPPAAEGRRMSRALVWFRRDLRLDDHPALQAAIEAGHAPVPVYIHAPEEEAPWAPGAASRVWLERSLHSLRASLRGLGSDLILRRGPSTETLLALAAECGARRCTGIASTSRPASPATPPPRRR